MHPVSPEIGTVFVPVSNIEAAHVHLQGTGSEVTEIRDGRWFNFKDPGGNVPMICACWQRPGAPGWYGHTRRRRRPRSQKAGTAAPRGGSGVG